MNQGKALIFSAPSGSGKSTIVSHLLQKRADLEFAISATTRSPRPHEQEGVHYYFLSEQEFLHRVHAGEFIEFEEVYPGTYYGTLRSELDRIWKAGKHVIFDLDVAGGVKINHILSSSSLAIFIKVGGISVLRQRLLSRGTESHDEIDLRVQKALEEYKFEKKFDVSIVNNDLTTALDEVDKLVQEFLEFKQ
ncbi:MAG: guanylate kinase [Flammeovirgaceae bacterium]|jgi:guanylate kinase|nr:guanylate kinase [Flammeovirgaceae bacterium]|tara:strand:+ start:1045 stop:1620 length:576 start_codon:yes stop_codon:yes gene_type:complete